MGHTAAHRAPRGGHLRQHRAAEQTRARDHIPKQEQPQTTSTRARLRLLLLPPVPACRPPAGTEEKTSIQAPSVACSSAPMEEKWPRTEKNYEINR